MTSVVRVADRRVLLSVAMAAIFAGSFAFRFLDPVLLNDHFEHVSMAMQIVHGQVPGVDFFDPGRPLQQYLSAAGLWLFGHQRLAEVAICVLFLSIGSTLVVRLAADVSGSVMLGVLAAVFVTAMGVRLYAYPKVVVAAITLVACARYIDAPSRLRLATLAVVVAIGFFFRYDYALYAGATVVMAVVARHWSEPRQVVGHVAVIGALTLLLCGPYLAFMASQGAFASGPGTGRLARLLGGEDLVTFESFTRPLHSATNAAVWLYDVFFVVPFAAAAALVHGVRAGTVPSDRAAKLLATIVLAVFFNLFLIRGNLDSRLPDVVLPIGVLMAWLLSLVGPLRPGRWRRAAIPLASSAVLLLTVGFAVNVYAAPMTHVERTHLLSGPRRTHGHLLALVRELRALPLDAYAGVDARGLPALTRYVARCTTETDHLLVTGYRPDVFFYASRLFAGGMIAFHANLGAAPHEQQLIINRLEQQHVPIVIEPTDDLDELRSVYPMVSSYLDQRYVLVRESGFGETQPLFRVLVQRDRQPSHLDEQLGLPCFAAAVSGRMRGGAR